ncbi:hypothetical protein G3578_03765 [Brevibacillus sp. SYP-B805]|uniref:hypothetical protein n=1 Tax=Brevibacillus sp. SYP-B805 TaxID=1578199 RepID=UPI0013ED76AD|nr:hypothetical protein [Brevibacillus sp. SYP-B805]NGQ94291.1 hypothetical protein [Brevibacillus sp. SYP-B805]
MVWVKKGLAILGILLLSGLLVNSMVMTYYLKKIDSGLNENLKSTQELAHYQESMLAKNGELQNMLSTVGTIDAGMDQAVARTSRLLFLLAQVVDLNAQTLQLNQDMESVSRQSGSAIAEVNRLVRELNPQTTWMKAYMEQIQQAAESDAENLDAIRRSTEKMNRKLPGVL